MKKLLSIVALCSYLQAGVESSTMIETSHGKKHAYALQVGDYVACMSQNGPVMKEITSIEDVVVDTIIEITTQDDVVLRVSPNQSLFIPCKWISADQVSLGDMLVTKDQTFIGIKSISRINTPYTMRFFNVADHHNFFAAPNGVLIHNGPLTFYYVYCSTKAALIAAAITGTAAAVCYTGGAVIAAGGGAGATATAVGTGAVNGFITGTTITVGQSTVIGGAYAISAEVGLATTAVSAGATVGTAVAEVGASTGLLASTAAAIEVAALATAAPFAGPWCW